MNRRETMALLVVAWQRKMMKKEYMEKLLLKKVNFTIRKEYHFRRFLHFSENAEDDLDTSIGVKIALSVLMFYKSNTIL